MKSATSSTQPQKSFQLGVSRLLGKYWGFLTNPHPSITEVGERRRAQLISALSLILLVSFTWAILSNPRAFTAFIFFLGITLTAYITSRTRFYRLGAYFFSFGFTSIAYINIYNGSANSIDTSISSIVPISLILASVILSPRAYLLLAISTVAATAFVRSYADPKYLADPVFSFGRAIGITFSTGVILYGITVFRASVEKDRLKEVQEINRKLETFSADLEQRVADRTRDLAIVAEVSTATATILNIDHLLQEVVDLSKERFNLYHSHVYLLDGEGKNLTLAAGAGESGRQMKAKGHSIPLDREQSLVAHAAREKRGVIVNDVTQSPDFLPNPLFPQTRSELAVPMIVGGKVIGVFDIQSDQVGRFTDFDISLQTTLAAQIATSVQNVHAFQQTRLQAEYEALVNLIGQKIQRTTGVEEALQTAIRELGTALGAARVKVKIEGDRSKVVSPLNSPGYGQR